ncbi:MAG: peptide ABC transporter substrate-binding protein [Anaerolineae bacterium]
MKEKPIVLAAVVLTVTVMLTFPLTSIVAAPTDTPLTLNLNLGAEPTTLDPALAADSASNSVIEQLFVGLVDMDDETAEIRPELATSWQISAGGTVYTFALRSDIVWTDGHPVTAQDVRYGILRSLDPATAADYAYVLFLIQNAEEYHNGAITDPNQVGVTALDDTHLQVTLDYPASYVLSILAMPVARPTAQWAIAQWGTAWTEPGHIVTNGAYRLSQWVHNDHIRLNKNPTYYDAVHVQIEQVKWWMVDGATEWAMYLNRQLDSASPPAGITLDPILRQELHRVPMPYNYYYGFSTSQPPFNNPLVRKAFIAATDRQGLIDAVLGGVHRPALTFTPPGVFGYVDGYAEGVGIQYNPVRARQLLAQAGYPNGQGLPPITLWFNTSSGQQAIAEAVRQSWHDALGVDVSLQSLPWSEYLQRVHEGRFQVWRMGWGADYADAYNFLGGGIGEQRDSLGGWNNPNYASLLDQALLTNAAAARRLLYKQAERILVETDAVVMPLVHYASLAATRPYLQRTYTINGWHDIATWRITRVSATISPGSGGTLTSYAGDTTIGIPAGAVSDTVVLTHEPAYGMPPGGNLTGIGHVFDLTAVDSAGQPAQLVPGHTYDITVRYTDVERGAAIENTLALYYWDGGAWVREANSQVDPAANTVSATPNHFSRWAVLGETRRVYLALTLKNR